MAQHFVGLFLSMSSLLLAAHRDQRPFSSHFRKPMGSRTKLVFGVDRRYRPEGELQRIFRINATNRNL
jgi:hypothetical protein